MWIKNFQMFCIVQAMCRAHVISHRFIGSFHHSIEVIAFRMKFSMNRSEQYAKKTYDKKMKSHQKWLIFLKVGIRTRKVEIIDEIFAVNNKCTSFGIGL